MNSLRVRGLHKSYGDREVVCGVDLEVAPGECFGLLGPNGAGKTTTLRLYHGVELARPLLAGALPANAFLNLAVLAAYALAGFYLATVLTRRRLLT